MSLLETLLQKLPARRICEGAAYRQMADVIGTELVTPEEVKVEFDRMLAILARKAEDRAKEAEDDAPGFAWKLHMVAAKLEPDGEARTTAIMALRSSVLRASRLKDRSRGILEEGFVSRLLEDTRRAVRWAER